MIEKVFVTEISNLLSVTREEQSKNMSHIRGEWLLYPYPFPGPLVHTG